MEKSHTNSTSENRTVTSYGKVVFNLNLPFFPEDKLLFTPSWKDGVHQELETDLRIYGCELITTAGALLKLEVKTISTAQLLLQRFYYQQSFVYHSLTPIVMACILLASKVEEDECRVKCIIQVFTDLRQVYSIQPMKFETSDPEYQRLKNSVLTAESCLLKELGFGVYFKNPYKILLRYIDVLECTNQILVKNSWYYLNDSLRTDAFMRYEQHIIVCACIYLSSKTFAISLPENPPWYGQFGATADDIKIICIKILNLYQRPKPNITVLQWILDGIRKSKEPQRARTRGMNENEDLQVTNTFEQTMEKMDRRSRSRSKSSKSRNRSTGARSIETLSINVSSTSRRKSRAGSVPIYVYAGESRKRPHSSVATPEDRHKFDEKLESTTRSPSGSPPRKLMKLQENNTLFHGYEKDETIRCESSLNDCKKSWQEYVDWRIHPS